jgi:signal transduction histidine kinase
MHQSAELPSAVGTDPAATPDAPPQVLASRGPPSLNGASVSVELARSRAEEQDRIAQELNDGVVRRIFAAGLDLHAALGLIGDHPGAGKIYHAIGELDHAIRDIRDTIFNGPRN